MDPNAALDNMKAAIDDMVDYCEPRTEHDAAAQLMTRVIEAFEALDEWLRKGGAMPADWYRESRASRWNLED